RLVERHSAVDVVGRDLDVVVVALCHVRSSCSGASGPLTVRRSSWLGIDRRLGFEAGKEWHRGVNGTRFTRVRGPAQLFEERRAAVAVWTVQVRVTELGMDPGRGAGNEWRRGE